MTDFEGSVEERTLTSEQKKEFRDKVKKNKDKGDSPGVIYIGHIPHGFVEKPMKEYFKQFGTVTRLRISRSKKTGKPKGYAFVEFKSEGVAKIVADSMNNYLMFHRLLKCQFMPISRVHPETFKGSGRKFAKPKAHTMAKERHNSIKSEKQQKTALRRLKAKKAKSMAKLAEVGITYEYPGIVSKDDVQKVLERKKDGAESEEEAQPEISQDKISSKVRQFLEGLNSDEDSSDNDFLKDSESENEAEESEEEKPVVVKSSKKAKGKKPKSPKQTGKPAKRKTAAASGKKSKKVKK